MPGGSTGARAAMSNQGVFTGQFDSNMADHWLIGERQSYKKFTNFQSALSNAMVKYCRNLPEDVKALINSMEEVEMDEPDMRDDSLLNGMKGDLHKSNYKDGTQERKQCMRHYISNKSTVCSVVLGQCDAAMQAKLQVTEDWETNKTYLLFVLKAAQVACISVQENYIMYIVGCEALQALTNCFKNTDTALVLKQRILACKQKMAKAGIGFKFGKKFLDSEKKKNPNVDNTTAAEAATNRFLGTMWLMNSDAPKFVSENLVQAHISGTDNYPESVKRAFTMVSIIEEATSDTGRSATSLAQANEASNGQY